MIFVLFILCVFKAPEVAKSIANVTGFPNLPDKILSFKWSYDTVVTDIPSKQELSDKYNSTLSWALELKENILNWVDSTKETVDSLRETMSWAEQTIEDLKDAYSEAKVFIDDAGKKIEETKKIIEDTTTVINNVKNLRENNSSSTTE